MINETDFFYRDTLGITGKLSLPLAETLCTAKIKLSLESGTMYEVSVVNIL